MGAADHPARDRGRGGPRAASPPAAWRPRRPSRSRASRRSTAISRSSCPRPRPRPPSRRSSARTPASCCATSRLFDIYRGVPLAGDEKSLAYRLRFGAGDRTLTEAEVEAAVAAVVGALPGRRGRAPRLSGPALAGCRAPSGDRPIAARVERAATLRPGRGPRTRPCRHAARRAEGGHRGLLREREPRRTSWSSPSCSGWFVLGFAQGAVRRRRRHPDDHASRSSSPPSSTSTSGPFLAEPLDAVPARATRRWSGFGTLFAAGVIAFALIVQGDLQQGRGVRRLTRSSTRSSAACSGLVAGLPAADVRDHHPGPVLPGRVTRRRTRASCRCCGTSGRRSTGRARGGLLHAHGDPGLRHPDRLPPPGLSPTPLYRCGDRARPPARPFPRDLLAGDTLAAARALLGARLVRDARRRPARGRPRRAGSSRSRRTSALDDRASHARMGPTPRNRVMFGPPGIAYVYLVYGMHHCLNVVTEAAARPAALLIRAVEPVGRASTRCAARRLAGRAPGACPTPAWPPDPACVGAAFGIDRASRASTCAIRRRRSASARARRRAGARDRRDARASASRTPASPGRAVPWRLVVRRQPVAEPAGAAEVDARSIALLEFPPSAHRLAEHTSFEPSRRLAEALVPSADPVIVARGLDETDQARALLQERPGVGIGAAHDIDPWVGRARARRAPRPAAVPRDRRRRSTPPSRLATALAEERRPLLRDLGRRIHPLPALRSTLARSFDPAGELLDTASPRLGGLRGGRPHRLRPAPPPPGLAGRLGARQRAPGADHHAAQRTLRGADPRRGPGQGQGHRPRRLRQRRRRCSWSRSSWWSSATPGARPRRRSTRRRVASSTSSRRWSAPTRTLLRETLEALAQFDFWAAKAQLAAEMDGVRPETSPTGPRSCCSRRATRG